MEDVELHKYLSKGSLDIRTLELGFVVNMALDVRSLLVGNKRQL